MLPPEREAEVMRASAVNITFNDDTSKVASPTTEALSVKKGDKSLVGRVSLSQSSEPTHSSFLDGISYNVGIETQGPTQLRFVFNTQFQGTKW